MTKSELRKIYLEKRRFLSVDELILASRQISDLFFASFDLSKIETLHCFIPIAKFNEIDTSLIYKKIWQGIPSIRTVTPHVGIESGEMESVIFTAETEHIENEWGIREPTTGEIVEHYEIDMVLVPLLCFDKKGHRVGYGKGFYDKFLGKCRPDCLKVGLSYFPPVADVTDIAGHDIELDLCVMPGNVFSFAK